MADRLAQGVYDQQPFEASYLDQVRDMVGETLGVQAADRGAEGEQCFSLGRIGASLLEADDPDWRWPGPALAP